MNVVILGATSGMGRALARLMAARGDRLFLLGIGEDELARSAADLSVRAPEFRGEVGYALCDLGDPGCFAPALRAAEDALGGVDCVIVTAGVFATQDALEADIDRTEALLRINFTNTVVFCEHARETLLARGGGTLCVFSSVAGDRGRKPVVLYGAAKAGLSRYLEGLDHRFRAQGLRTVCVKPGFVKTGMTVGLKPPPFAGEPEAVARTVLAAIDAGKPVVYAPPIWRVIMLVIRMLPRALMRRLGF
ncbi:MAG: SDR family NAD(P)-dependent oxidoreductase [Nannocystaceae bacterium]|nr:SDR family NAD(P)-dependent oxidoreductase [Myxococcales bacterium]